MKRYIFLLCVVLVGCTYLQNDLIEASQSGDVGACRTFQDDKRDLCVLSIIHDVNNPNDCSLLTEPNLKQGCYFTRAIGAQDPEICLFLDQSTAVRCVQKIALDINSSNVCQTLHDEETQAACLTNFAFETQDYTGCVDIIDERLQHICLNDALPIVRPCASIKDLQLQKLCYLEVALVNNDAALCESMTDLKDLCYSDIALSTQNNTLCTSIVDEVMKQNCVETTTRD